MLQAFYLPVSAASLLFLEGLGFMAFVKPNTILSPLLNQWKNLLQQWAKVGSLATAAQEALLLSGIPEGLQMLIDEWAAADFKSLPEVELLSAADINGALGAYAISTGKIYLNADWLEGASKEQVFAVLTEELGHHLDGLFNALDTPGDEGELFAALLQGEGAISIQLRERLNVENDHGNLFQKPAELLHIDQYRKFEQLDVEFAQAGYFRPSAGVGIDNIGDSDVFNLASFPESNLTLYLDFNGEKDLTKTVWYLNPDKEENKIRSVDPFSLDDTVNTDFSPDELAAIKEIFLRVSADFAPFNINVTTKYPEWGALERYSNLDTTFGATISIGNIGNQRPEKAGIAQTSKFSIPETFDKGAFDPLLGNGGNLLPDWFETLNAFINVNRAVWGAAQVLVFPAGPYYKRAFAVPARLGNEVYSIANTVTHELGHLLGLEHDGNASTAYYNPESSSYLGWGAIMGAASQITQSTITQFSRGEYDGATNWGEYNNVDKPLNSNENDFLVMAQKSGLSRFTDDNKNKHNSADEIYFGRDDIGFAFGHIDLMSMDGLAPVDEDYFQFQAPRTGKIQMSAVNALSYSVSGNQRYAELPVGYGNLHLDLQLYDIGLNLIADWSNDSELDVNGLTVDVVKDKFYYLKVLPNANLPNRIIGETTWGSLGGYLIKLESLSSLPDDHANGIGIYNTNIIAGSSRSGIIENKSDRDVFRTFLASGISYEFDLSIELDRIEGVLSPSLILRDSNNNILDSNETNVSSRARLYFTPSTSDVYYLDAGSYMSRSTGSYTIKANQLDDYAGDISTSLFLGTNNSVSGKLDDNIDFLFAKDHDWVKVYLLEGKSYILKMESLDRPLYGFLQLRDANGLLIDDSDSNSNISSETKSIVFFTPSSSSNYYLDLSSGKKLSGNYIFSNLLDNPEITLEVTTSSVTEESAQKLVYTFTRTGDLNGSKVVNYTVGGTAALGTDYNGISNIGTAKTVTFQEGLATAIVTVDALMDSEVEPDETVILTLAPGNGYSIITDTPITGTITDVVKNVDLNKNRVVRTPIRATYPFCTSGEFRNEYNFAALKADGSVVTWGSIGEAANEAANLAKVATLTSGVTQIYSNERAFAALKNDGSVVTWGSSSSGGDSISQADRLTAGVIKIFSTSSAFAALKDNGSVVTWGGAFYGGDSSAQADNLKSGVTRIFSTTNAFAALKANGSVITWGNSSYGGDSSAVSDKYTSGAVGDKLTSGVIQIFSTGSAFAALKADGSVVTWGNRDSGGYTSNEKLTSGVTQIFSNERAFAALKNDGSVVTWGSSTSGGDSNNWYSSPSHADKLTSGVSQIFSTERAFAALKADGSVVTWGDRDYGGDPRDNNVKLKLTSGVTQIFSTGSAFAALKADGSVVTWGGSSLAGSNGGNSDTQKSSLTSGVMQIFSTNRAFAALKADGSVVTWGDSLSGGNSSAVSDKLTSGVTQIFSTGSAFAALKADGSVVTWGNGSGADSSAVAKKLSSGVVAFADPFADDRLVANILFPNITLSVSPASITENGITNLVYTFSRTGATTNVLTVSYNVGGTAALGIDYTGIAATPSTKTVTFAAGSAIAIVTIDPTVDTEIEPDETVIFTLAPGSEYIIGAIASAVGTITNNNGQASFSITGTRAVGQILNAAALTADPDGNGSDGFSYTWLSSNDGSTWARVGTTGSYYTIADDDEGKQLQVLSSYIDEKGFAELVTISAGSVPSALEVPTYTLTPSAATINEGAVLTSTVATTNVDTGTKFYYALSGTGITTADFSAGALTGEGITDATGKFTFTHTLANDLTTEGAKTLNIKLFSDSSRSTQVGTTASVSIADTSINPFNLDIDGDGKITALGDGLMVIRKLFGAAFAGDALTNKAMSPSSTRTTAEIHEFIQQGMITGLLDVDKDGKTTALGDGLMVIRHLFGAAFANEALTNKAISPSSPYFGPPINHAAVAANIDALRILQDLHLHFPLF